VRRRPVRAFAPPLDLRFIDLFMAIVMALSFIAIMLTVVARMLPTEVSQPPAREQTEQAQREQRAGRMSAAQLKRELDAAVDARRKAEAELQAARTRIAEAEMREIAQRNAFALPWWLIGLCALLGAIAVFMNWRIRLWNKGSLPRLRSWLLVTLVVAVVTMVVRSLSDSDGYLMLAEIPWWAAEALCLGLLLVAYVLISLIRADRTTLGEIRVRAAGGVPSDGSRSPSDGFRSRVSGLFRR
jgi:hypothetical protein